MQVAVADAGGEHAQQHFGALRLRSFDLDALQRLAAGANLEAAHEWPLSLAATAPAKSYPTDAIAAIVSLALASAANPFTPVARDSSRRLGYA
jgi:hypothetical protein